MRAPTEQSFGIEIYCEDRAWRGVAADLEQRLRQAVQTTLVCAPDTKDQCALTILLTDDGQLCALNRAHRGKNKPTNVLSFPAPAGADYLGDIAIAFGTASREAEESGKSLVSHVLHLAVHGVLHLLGYDHEASDEAKTMEALEVDILSRIGVPDPYRRQFHVA